MKRHRTDAIADTVPFQFSSVQDGIYALRRAQVSSSRSLRSFPKCCLKRWVLKLGSKAGRAVTNAIAVRLQFSSVQDGISTLRKAPVCSPLSLRSLPKYCLKRWVLELGLKAGRERWGLWQNRETEGRERELRAVTKQENRRQGERGLRTVTEQENKRQGERVKGCDRTGKQKNSRFVTEQENRRIPGLWWNRNSMFVTEQGNRRIPCLWQNRETEEFHVCDRPGKQKNSRFVTDQENRRIPGLWQNRKTVCDRSSKGTAGLYDL